VFTITPEDAVATRDFTVAGNPAVPSAPRSLTTAPQIESLSLPCGSSAVSERKMLVGLS
jgi:hypothetical protein